MEVVPMNFLNRSYFFPIILTASIIAGALSFSAILVKDRASNGDQQLFLQRHVLPITAKQKFKSFFKIHKLEPSLFTMTEEELEQRLTDLGFQRTATGSNALVMRCPEQLGNFVVKAPGRFHEVTRAVVDKPLENISRAQGADRINKYAIQADVQKVKAVDEYLFHIPGAPKELSDYNYLVVEPYLDLDQKKSFDDFSLQQFKETVDIIDAVEYGDTHADNIVLDKNGIVYFLDTSQRDYLAKYQNLPSALYFSNSSQSDDAEGEIASCLSHEEQLIQSMKDSDDLSHVLAAQKASAKLDVIYHGLMPLGKEKIDAAKRAYLQEKVDKLVQEIEVLVAPFKKTQVIQAEESNSKSLYEIIQTTFAQYNLQEA